MAKLECTKSQLQLIQTALDFYSRIGIGQWTEIKNHPTFEENLYNVCIPDKTLEVGDHTPQGDILEIKDKKALINGSVDKKTNMWCNKPEWKKLEDVKLSTDYSKFHDIRDRVDDLLAEARNVLIQENSCGKNGSWGIYNKNVDDSCREAYNMIQVIRYELNKVSKNPCEHCVSSSVDSWIENKIKVSIDES
jgi:hypothetical protein